LGGVRALAGLKFGRRAGIGVRIEKRPLGGVVSFPLGC